MRSECIEGPIQTDEAYRACQAWAAGLFEGEGTIAQEYPGHLRLMLKMTDEDVIRRLAEAVGGRVYGPYVPRPQRDGYIRKPCWVWTSSSVLHAKQLLAAWWPWLGWRRRARARQVLEDVVAFYRGGC